MPDNDTNLDKDPDRDPWVGRVVNGKYRIAERLGAGGMGKVYRCDHTLLPGRSFALKILHSNLRVDESVRARFLREGEILLSLVHPCIVTVRDLGLTVEGQVYLCLDYCEGVPLAEVLRRRGRLAPPDALRIVEQILDGLTVAHRAGVVHRDLKPENIMITAGAGEDLQVKILDFGIAHLGEAEAGGLTQQGVILGTPRYMSPEQAMGETLDARSDLYSVGLILYEMLVGEPAIGATSTRTIIARQRAAAIDPIGPQLHGHPWRRGIDALLGRVLVANPDDRVRSADEFLRLVREVLMDQRKLRSVGPSRRLVGCAIVAVVAAFGASAGFWLPPTEAGAPTKGKSEEIPIVGEERNAPDPGNRERATAEKDDSAAFHACPICGYRRPVAGICPVDGVRLSPREE